MSMTDSYGWEVLDMNKITVYLADLKNTITDMGNDINERLDNLEKRIVKVEGNITRVQGTIDNNYRHYERNKMLYMEILERLSLTNEKVKPLLDQLNRSNTDIKNKLCNPFVQSARIYNRFWRSSVIPSRSIDKSISPSLLEDITEIDEDECHDELDNVKNI